MSLSGHHSETKGVLLNILGSQVLLLLFFADGSKALWFLFLIDVCLWCAIMSVFCSLVITCRERALMRVMFPCVLSLSQGV